MVALRSHVRWAGLAAALGVLALAPVVRAQPGDTGPSTPGTRAPRDASLDVPWTTVDGEDCALELAVSLAPLGAGATSLAFVAVSPGAGAACDRGTVLWELPRRLFNLPRAQSQARDARIRTRIAAPLVACDTAYSVLVCARDVHGRLQTGVYAGHSAGARQATTTTFGSARETVATPSGPARTHHLSRGHAVLALDPSTTQLVETTVRRWLAPKRSTRPRPVVDVRLDDERTVMFLADERVWDADARLFRRAANLTPGTPLLGPDARTPHVRSVTRRQTPAVSATQLDVAWPDTLFVSGVLVHDAVTRGSTPPHTPPPAYAPPASRSVTVQPAVQSWDCQLTVEVAIDTLPQATQSVAIVTAPHTGAPGARRALACGAGTVSTELARALLDAVRRDGGPGARVELTLSGGAVHCEALVDVLACLRDGSGALAPAEPLARVGRAGPTCLAAGTLIDTPSGAVTVESLTVGAPVVSRDPTSGRTMLAIVERLQPIDDRPVRDVLLDDGSLLRATPEHLVWSVTRRAFVRVDTLRVGERLSRRVGGAVRVRELQDRGLRETVYDLSVTSPDTYFASGVLCHNY